MALIVQKFGGSSVKDRDRIFNVARIVANTHNAGNDVVVVVSAQGDTTDDLIAKAAEISHDPSAREMDMLLAAGEEISISLLAMALNEIGCHATSLTGWQAGFRTDRAYTKARITKLETERISSELERNRVVVVAGFQGLNKLDDITTLGRGGSDTSAVAIAARAARCPLPSRPTSHSAKACPRQSVSRRSMSPMQSVTRPVSDTAADRSTIFAVFLTGVNQNEREKHP